MIRINLLPFRAARKKENIRRQVSMFFLFFGFVLATLLYFNFIYLTGKLTKLKTSVDQTQKDVKRYKKITKEIESIKKKLAVLKKKTDVIKKLEKNRFEPVNLLETMTQKVIAKRMWFTRFQTKKDQVNIMGIALDNKTVADFMTRLEGTGLFASVKLNKIQIKVIKGSRLKSFQIVCTKPKAAPKPPKKKRKKRKRKK
jgi:type IV pilus assembly protein PilN